MNGLLPLALFVGFLIFFLVALFRIAGGRMNVTLKPLGAARTLRLLAGQSVEEGTRLHLSLGTGELNTLEGVETLQGLIVLDELASQAARTGQAPVVTTAAPGTMLIAQDQLRAGDAERGWRTFDNARFVAPTPAAYGLGTRGMMAREGMRMNALLGHFGEEYLFLAVEQPSGGTEVRRPQVAGTARLETLPLVHLTSEQPLLGEHLFAIGAYLQRWPSHLAGQLTQEAARWTIVAAIVLGTLLASVGIL